MYDKDNLYLNCIYSWSFCLIERVLYDLVDISDLFIIASIKYQSLVVII